MRKIQTYVLVSLLFVFTGDLVSAQRDKPIGSAEPQVIGPGKVHFSITPGGRWVSFTFEGAEGRNLIAGGGFVVFARDENGDLKEIINTSSQDLRVRDNARDIPPTFEGVQGGFRAPSLHPDDDRDGRTDEDRLDGLDNDGDDRIDEDFAAIGDEMWVTEFTNAAPGAFVQLLFHLETYAWSLPHINRAVMVGLEIENTGLLPLHDVRVGTVFDKYGPFTFEDRTLAIPTTSRDLPTPARALVCTETSGASMVMIAFAADENERDEWICGLADATTGFLDLGALEESRDVAEEDPGFVGPRAMDSYIAGDAVVYGVSPVIPILERGEAIHINFALIATPLQSQIDDAVVNTVKTYRGDGDVSYLPPPVSMRPRLLWGKYRPLEGEEPRLAITFEDASDGPISADDISIFSGIDPNQLDKREAPTGEIELVLSGDTAEGVLLRGERVSLKGRLESGEFFEAVLRPARDGSAGDVEAELFWKTSGKLKPELLNGSPNPFRNSTTIFYEIPAVVQQEDGSEVRSNGPFETSVKVYNVAGRLVSVLVDEQSFPGTHSINWNAVDDNGNAVASGVYYLKLQIEKRFITKRLILLK